MNHSIQNAENNDEYIDGMKKERFIALKGNYQKPELTVMIFPEQGIGECSDMASCSWGA